MSEVKLLYKNEQLLKGNRINNILREILVTINHELTSTNRKIFWLTKQVANEDKRKYDWSHLSSAYVMKNDGL